MHVSKIRSVFILAGLLFVTALVAQEFGVGALPSLEWQRQSLEKNIEQKIDRNLAPILKSDEYLINIDISTSIPETPDFYTSEHELEMEGSADGRLSQAEELALEEGITPEEAQTKLDKKEKTKANDSDKEDDKDPQADRNNAKVKFSDASPDESAEDYILFSKLGIEAPLVDNFNDFQPDGKILLTMDASSLNGQQSNQDQAQRAAREAERRKKAELERMKSQFQQREQKLTRQIKELENATREPSVIEQAWKYNQASDIFNNLRSVDITVTFNDKLKQVTRDSVERTLNGMNFGLGSVEPSLNIEYIPMDEVKVDERSFAQKAMELLEKFNLALGLILAALIIGALAYLMLKKYMSASQEQQDSNTNMNGQLKSESSKEDEDESGKESGGGAAGDASAEDAGLDGYERLRAFLEKSPSDACLLIKRWIKTGEESENNALRGVVQQLDNASLVDIFKKLDEEEKGHWKSLLSKSLGPDKLKKAGLFISNQIVEEIILPSVIVDEEACDLLLRIKPHQAAGMIENKPELGMIILNVMNTKFVNQILSNVSEDKVEVIIQSSLEYTPEAVDSQMDNLKTALKQYLDQPVKVPFVEKVKELIPLASVSKELPLYNALASAGEIDAITEIATKRFPAFLMDELPENLLKAVMTRYPIDHKIPFLLSCEKSKRDFYLGISAPEGSKARDLIEIEFESAENDIAIQKKVRNNQEQLKQHFVDYLRNYLEEDKSFQGQVDEVVTNWVGEIAAKNETHQNIRSLNEAG